MSPAITARDAAPRLTSSNYPLPFAELMKGRTKRPLGDPFGVRNFGVNLTTLEPGARSSLQHRHSKQDEFIYVTDGNLTVVCGSDEWTLSAGMCLGFPANGSSHHIENRSKKDASYLEIGDRTLGDEVSYPHDDLVAKKVGSSWHFTRKNGRSY